jgi:hypothetical protein
MTRPIASRSRWRNALASAAFLVLGLASSREARAQTPFDGCGTIVPGITCPRLFSADSGGLWLLDDFGAFQVGDYVRVVGTADPGCFTICQQGGCINGNTIGLCAVCACGVFCAGDGSGVACPCGNSGAPGHGCANSVNPSGGLLTATGNSSLSNDTVVLLGSGMPDSSVLYFQGTTQHGGGAGATFGDGKRCAGGTVTRLGTKTNAGGASQYPAAGDTAVSVRGGVTSPGVRTYQAWYRNAASFCTAATFNLTNGIEIIWGA